MNAKSPQVAPKSLKAFVESLVRDNAHYGSDGFELDIYSLNDTELNEFSVLILNDLPSEDKLEFLSENPETYLAILATYLQNPDSINASMFTKKIRDELVLYFEGRMEKLIDTQCAKMDVEYRADMRSGQRKDNGEYYYYI